MTNEERISIISQLVQREMLILARIRTAGVLFVVLCWMFTIYSVYQGAGLP